MAGDRNLETRLEAVEALLSMFMRELERSRHQNRALQTILCTLIDSFKPDDPVESDEWLEAMQYVAVQNASLIVDLASDEVIRDHGLDPEMLTAMEDERAAVTEMLNSIYSMLKRPSGELRRE